LEQTLIANAIFHHLYTTEQITFQQRVGIFRRMRRFFENP